MTKLYQFPSGKISYLSQSTSPAGSVDTAPLSLSGAAYTGVSSSSVNVPEVAVQAPRPPSTPPTCCLLYTSDYATSNKPAESKPATTGAINLPATGTYTFTGRASIKAEAKVSSPELAYYDKGMSVNYDKVLTADGRQWLSYVTASGARRYVDIAAAKAEAKPEVKPVAKPADKPSLPESGTYTFTGRASIKAEAKVSSPEIGRAHV